MTRYRDVIYLDLAAKEALKGIRKNYGGPFGAVIIRKGKIIAKSHNTVLKTNNPICHAEMNAITQASKKMKRFDLSACEIYSTTEPCPMCFSAIHWARIKKIVYGTTISDVKKLGFNELSISNKKLKRWGKSKVRIVKIKNQACNELLKTWNSMPKRKTY